MHRRTVAATIVAALLGTMACAGSSPSSPTPDGMPGFDAHATAEGLRLRNDTDRTVYYAAFEHDWGTRGLFLFGPCTDAPRCPSIAAGATVTVPFDEITGYTPEAEKALVYTWHLVPSGTGDYEIRDLGSRIVPF